MSVNYSYIVHKIKSLHQAKRASDLVCLDFGCGAGQVVERGLEAGLDFYGADPYPENRSEHYEETASKRSLLDNRIFKIENDCLPFPDNHFDVVVSNVVFEHIEDLNKPLSEINRVLKPEGHFLALFPTQDTWWEGHVKLYFAHWLNPPSKMCHIYLKSLKALGFGINDERDPEEWAEHYKYYLHEYCFYRSISEVKFLWKKYFASLPENHAYDYMLFRCSKKTFLKPILGVFKNRISRFILEQVCRVRAGRVLLVRKGF